MANPMVPVDNPQANPKSFIWISAALLTAYTAIVAWVSYNMSISWPHEGSWADIVLWFLCPGIVFQAFSIIYTWRTRRRLVRRTQTRIITIPAGLLAAVALSNFASALAMDSFERAYAPYVAEIGANLAAPCLPGARYFESASVAAYNLESDNRHPKARLRYDTQRFVLAFSGGSMDIDGSTIYYDSNTKQWNKFHNDRSAASAGYAKLTEGLAACSLQAQ